MAAILAHILQGMVYDEELAAQIRDRLPAGLEVTEARMFGGLAFLVGGHLAIAASGRGGAMVRCDPAETEALVAEEGVARMVMRGRELDGWLRVEAAVVGGLQRWVDTGTTYAGSLPPK